MKLRKGQEFQIGRLSLITEKSNSLIILSNIMPFSFSPTLFPLCNFPIMQFSFSAYFLCSSV
ncbi:hypothetical protein BpHYR1_018464 [Brachionus plicatilis]|uniref:Uncharacterized protein n=1 Tax=Brachionus plicatilis TaxID=10195 RepID=A0A3M7QEZ1_BRAPC|nr:hypothetical protein BpHYR1_018464 [Brachionus plicatilis]